MKPGEVKPLPNAMLAAPSEMPASASAAAARSEGKAIMLILCQFYDEKCPYNLCLWFEFQWQFATRCECIFKSRYQFAPTGCAPASATSPFSASTRQAP